jgi:hypothetical protein
VESLWIVTGLRDSEVVQWGWTELPVVQDSGLATEQQTLAKVYWIIKCRLSWRFGFLLLSNPEIFQRES